MMQEFYDKFHPTVKDVEANAERESGERILGKIQNRKAGFCSFREIWTYGLKLEKRMMKKKFASLMPDQNIGNIGLEEALNSFASKDLGYKERSSGQ
jgi:DNA topoisomerase-1